MSGPVARVLDRLQGVRRTRRGGLGVCPSHADHRPSLDVSEGADGRALIVCRAGCRTPDVLAALDLRWADLFPPRIGDMGAAPRPRSRTLDETDHARRDVLDEARRQLARIDHEAYAEADSIRICDRVVREARALATRLGSSDDVWALLALAADLETRTRAAETRLDPA